MQTAIKNEKGKNELKKSMEKEWNRIKNGFQKIIKEWKKNEKSIIFFRKKKVIKRIK